MTDHGAKAYAAIFEGNGDSLMTRMKVAETRLVDNDRTRREWRSISTKMLIGGLLSCLGALAQILYHVMSK